MAKTGYYTFFGFLLLAFIVFADQYVKWLIIETVLRMDGEFLPFQEWFITPDILEYFVDEREVFHTKPITPFLDLVMVWNQGISFGILDTNKAFAPYIFAGISSFIAFALIIWMVLTRYFVTTLSIALIAGGAIGNTIDRIRFGAVADFIDLYYKDFHWPAFNIADICITVGAFLLVYMILFVDNDTYKTVDV